MVQTSHRNVEELLNSTWFWAWNHTSFVQGCLRIWFFHEKEPIDICNAWEESSVIWRTYHFSSPFFVSQPKRNGESTQLVWKQIPFRLRDSPIMHSSVPDEFKPVIFAAGSGCEWVGCFSGLPDWMGGYTGLRIHPVYWKIDEHWTAENSKMILCMWISDSPFSRSSQAVTSSEVLQKGLLISCVASGNDLNVQNSQKCWESKADSPSRVNPPGN